MCFGAVAEGDLPATVESERDAGEDMRGYWGEDKEWLQGERLVVWAGQEEEVV